jgi:hypothetical protein
MAEVQVNPSSYCTAVNPWLTVHRDHCHCKHCVNKDTLQRSFDTFTVLFYLTLTKILCLDRNIRCHMTQEHNTPRITAAYGLNVGTACSTNICTILIAGSGQDQHVSEYSWDWLFRHQGDKPYTVECVIMSHELQEPTDKP